MSTERRRSISAAGQTRSSRNCSRPAKQIGCGVVDLSFQTPGSENPNELMESLELFGKKCCRTSATSEK
jgi:hypothetical protein